jgi:polysaccharide biosynthesis protein PslH
MRILFLAHLFPLPLDSGGKIKSFYTLKVLAAEHEVVFLSFIRGDEENYLSQLQEICPNIRVIKLNRSKVNFAKDALVSLCSDKSFIISRDYRAEMQTAFNELVKEFQPDIVHIDHLQMAQYVSFNSNYKTLLDEHNVEYMIIKRVSESSSSALMRAYAALEWKKLRYYEINICSKADLVVCVSDEDKNTLLSDVKINCAIEAVPIGVDTNYFKAVDRKENSKTILSIATMYWPPNVDSMLYFCNEIFPLIKKELPDANLNIAGQKPVKEIQALASDSILVSGYVSDSREIAVDCGVFIVPLRSGSGVRVKILNAMAMGLPIVTTSIGVEGLNCKHNEHLIIADSPKDFADAVVELIQNKEKSTEIGKNARELVESEYSWDIIGKRLLKVYSRNFKCGFYL